MNPSTTKRGRKTNPLRRVNFFHIKLDNGTYVHTTVNLESLPVNWSEESRAKLIEAAAKPRIKSLIKADLETQATRIEAAQKLYEAMTDPQGKLKADPTMARTFLLGMGHILEPTSEFTLSEGAVMNGEDFSPVDSDDESESESESK
jgi:hypothetical protein